MRQIILDTETTGLDPSRGHRIIEIGCLELVNRRPTRRSFHHYLQPDREIDPEAIAVHGITNEQLRDKPRFRDVVDAFMAFVDGAELVIHNAAFDIGFLNHELKMLGRAPILDHCTVLDTLTLARSKHPGQKVNLDALARRYGADQRDRTYHGALLDAEILSDVYLAMTGGQVGLMLGADDAPQNGSDTASADVIRRLPTERPRLRVVRADATALDRHRQRLAVLDKNAGGSCLFSRLDGGEAGA